MRIHNDTVYRSREIKSLLCAAHDYLARAEGRLRRWGRTIFQVAYTRQYRGASGHATLNGTVAKIRLFRPPEDARDDRRFRRRSQARHVLRVGWHELLHLYGYDHSQMARKYPGEDEVAEMAEMAGMEPSDRLPLYAHAREDQDGDDEPTEREQREEELRHALRKRKQWTTKARRAKTGLRKWRRKENRARRHLEDLGVDVEAIREDELGDYEPAMAGDLDV